MASQNDRQAILREFVLKTPDRTLDDVLTRCPRLALNEILSEIERSSRVGQLRLTPVGRGA